ncbi:polysaccharide pyruvyl transferase family protein [Variovorax paradoxus]|nr:polysaccharide pyruvyl transferase family protein [Variovorax paradoxus]
MNIGVLTLHRCINYGSFWQARCLVEGLRARGHQAVLLDHRSRRAGMAELRCALQPVLPTPVRASDRPLYVSKTRKFFSAFLSLPCSPSFSLDDPGATHGHDVVVVGSDEVWNLRHPWYSGCALFFGEGVASSRLISYAASFGSYPADQGLEPCWSERLRSFDRISVRDLNSRALVGQALGKEPELVLDPCLQFAPAQAQPALPSITAALSCVAVYGHNFSPWFIDKVRRWASRHGQRLVSIGYRNDWADAQWIDAGPEEFADFIAGSEAVVTNFFHGCVFALRHDKPFVCERSTYRSIKIADLMGTVGAEAHLISPDTGEQECDERLSGPPAAAIGQRIRNWRHRSDTYLDQALAPAGAAAGR